MTYQEYIDKARANGLALCSYACPDCNGQIETLAAPVGEKWDTLSKCPHCPGTHMKFTDGPITTAKELK